MDDKAFLNSFRNKSQEEILLGMTQHYLASLSPAMQELVYRGAILRWWNLEVLAGTMEVAGGGVDAAMSPEEQYEQLQKLPFSEVFPKRGHSFHDLTRKVILVHLWQHEKEFYIRVSGKAAEYFKDQHEKQHSQLDEPGQDLETMDWGSLVEYVYHRTIADEEGAFPETGDILAQLVSIRQLGVYHAVVEAVDEHARAGRLSPGREISIKLWRLDGAYQTDDIDRLVLFALELLSLREITPEIKGRTLFRLADGFRIASRYDEAHDRFEQLRVLQLESQDLEGLVDAELGLGNVAYDQEDFGRAKEYYESALIVLIKLLMAEPDKELFSEKDTLLRLKDPGEWHRRELRQESPEQQTTPPGNEAALSSLNEENNSVQETVIQYSIEISGQEQPMGVNSLVVALIWLKLGHAYSQMDEYILASSCGRLSWQLYADLDSLPGVQAAAQLLRNIGVTFGDKQYIKNMRDFQHDLVDRAVARRDRKTQLYGLISQAQSDYDEDNYDKAREKYSAAYTIADSLGFRNEKATCMDGLARLDWTAFRFTESEQKFRLAIELYKAVQNKEGWATTLLTLGDLKLARYRVAEAEQEYRAGLLVYEQLGTFSGNFECLLCLSKVTLRQGRTEEAINFLQAAINLAQNNHRVSYEIRGFAQLANLHLSMGDDGQAEKIYEEAFLLAQRIGQRQLIESIRSNKVDLLVEMAEYERAIQVLDEIIATDPLDASAYMNKGWALENLSRGRAAEALAAYQKADELGPGKNWVQKGIANAYQLMGETKEAAGRYQFVIEQLEKNAFPSFYSTLAWCYLSVGKFELAEDTLRKLIGDEVGVFSDYLDLALVLLRQHRFSDALAAYRQGLSLLSQKFPALCRRETIYVAREDINEMLLIDPTIEQAAAFKEILQMLYDAWESTRIAELVANP